MYGHNIEMLYAFSRWGHKQKLSAAVVIGANEIHVPPGKS